MKCVKYDDLIDKLMTCAYRFKRVETWEDIINIINEVPTFVAVPAPNYRVPSKEEWMERYCTNKQLAGYKKRNKVEDWK